MQNTANASLGTLWILPLPTTCRLAAQVAWRHTGGSRRDFSSFVLQVN
jgi:hypothetical protein